MAEKRKPRRGRGGVSECVLAGGCERSEDSPNIIRFPEPIVAVEANPLGLHGWRIVTRRGRREWHRRSVALRSVAFREAEQKRGPAFWWHQ